MYRKLGGNVSLINLLVKNGVVTEDDVDEARKIGEQKGGKIDDILVEQGFADVNDMLGYKAFITETVPIHLDGLTIPDDVLKCVPRDVAIKHRLIPISRTSEMVTIAMANPSDIYAIDAVEEYSELSVLPVISIWKEIEEAIDRSYKPSEELLSKYLEEAQPGGELETIRDESEEIGDDVSLKQLAEEAPIVGLVDIILRHAIENQASDIHIEEYQDRLSVRFRIDGVLEERYSPPKRLHSALVSRIKIMSNMDIAERRRPQDGRLGVKTPRGNVNLRVSTLPTAFGERTVIRIADEAKTMFGLSQLGMPQKVLEKYVQSIKNPRGMILVTGPTGSGKTSTLYASLNRVNKPDVSIITVEDPIEYLISGLNQVEIDPKAGRTFASVLRSILRQDPDIIMIGEIRDIETVELGVQAALTGHLVFSTLHTNDASSAISRLLDLAVEPFLISASVSCIIAQRLARTLCPNCKKPYEPSQDTIGKLKLPPDDYTFFEKEGCTICNGKGYKGRTGIYEVMFMNEEIRELTAHTKDIAAIQEAAIRDGMKTLRQAAIDRVVAGITTLEEAFRVTSD